MTLLQVKVCIIGPPGNRLSLIKCLMLKYLGWIFFFMISTFAMLPMQLWRSTDTERQTGLRTAKLRSLTKSRQRTFFLYEAYGEYVLQGVWKLSLRHSGCNFILYCFLHCRVFEVLKCIGQNLSHIFFFMTTCGQMQKRGRTTTPTFLWLNKLCMLRMDFFFVLLFNNYTTLECWFLLYCK